jgi:hypothetical protein
MILTRSSQGGSPPLDILVRISGVNRLSDFLLWQVRFFSAIHPPASLTSPLQCCENAVRLVGFRSHHPRLPEESLVTQTDAILFVVIHSFMGFRLLFHSLKELPHHRVQRSAMTI